MKSPSRNLQPEQDSGPVSGPLRQRLRAVILRVAAPPGYKKAGDYMPVFHFTDVGRNKQCFTVECRDLDEAARAVMRSGAIRSSSVDLLQPEESHEGIVLVGGYRPVGRFTVEQLN